MLLDETITRLRKKSKSICSSHDLLDFIAVEGRLRYLQSPMLNIFQKYTCFFSAEWTKEMGATCGLVKKAFYLFLCCTLMGIWGSCSNIDCPLDNVVSMQCNLFSYETKSALTLTDELTVTPAGRDTTLLNKASNIQSFLLPLKETAEGQQVATDTLLLHFSNVAEQSATDTLFVSHMLHPHFESLDCPASVFHTITAVRTTSHPLSEMPLTVDSVSLVRSIVNYDDVENIRIFLRSTSSK